MRIFGLEITRAPDPKAYSPVWNRRQLPRRVNDLSPQEAREELEYILEVAHRGGGKATITISSSRQFLHIT